MISQLGDKGTKIMHLSPENGEGAA